jgi:hypothetical protein
MAEDLDSLLNDYHSRYSGGAGTKPETGGGSSITGHSYAGAEKDQPEGGNFLVTGGRFAKGAAKGLVGEASTVLPMPQGLSDWAQSPSESKTESIGNFAGATAPFMIRGPAGVAGKAWPVAEGMVRGGLAAGLQPTKEGTLTSHLENAGIGALAGAVPGVTSAFGRGGLHTIAHLARLAHIPIPHASRLIALLNHLGNTGELQRVASALGVATGQTLDPGGSYAKDQ